MEHDKRKKLGKLFYVQRYTKTNTFKFVATIEKRSHDRKKILLVDVYNLDKIITNHVWLNNEDAQVFKGIKKTTICSFYATVVKYTRKDGSMDFGLTNVKNLKILN